MQLADFRALTFDCYGTLIDWESGITKALSPLIERANRQLTRNEVLEAFARQEFKQEAQTPTKRYSELLSVVYKRLAEQWGTSAGPDECEAFGASIGDWPVFPDTVDALQYLRKHFKLIILSNVDNRSFASSNKKLGEVFDAIYTAEDAGAYKPSPQMFDYMLGHIGDLGLAKEDILHTAESLFHDHAPANALGLAKLLDLSATCRGRLWRNPRPRRHAQVRLQIPFARGARDCAPTIAPGLIASRRRRP